MFRPIKIRQYLSFMKERGFPADLVLADSGLCEAALFDPDFLMDIDQAKQVVANMIALADDQSIGLEIGDATMMVDLGVLGFVMMSAKSIREAVQHWINYSNSLIGMLLKVSLEERSVDDWSLVVTASAPLEVINNFCIEEQLVMIYKLGGQLASAEPVLRQLELSYQQPSHHMLYTRYFRGPIKFNARQTRMSFISPRLDQPLRGNDKEFNAVCARQCELLLKQIERQSPFISKIKSVLLRSGGRNPGISAVARDLSMSTRTLSRHLSEEGLTFQQLINEFRSDLAKEYLRSQSMEPKEIAYLLGFLDTNSFRRAFKSWTGLTIKDFVGKARNR